jgi:hypothetical protein
MIEDLLDNMWKLLLIEKSVENLQKMMLNEENSYLTSLEETYKKRSELQRNLESDTLELMGSIMKLNDITYDTMIGSVLELNKQYIERLSKTDYNYTVEDFRVNSELIQRYKLSSAIEDLLS